MLCFFRLPVKKEALTSKYGQSLPRGAGGTALVIDNKDIVLTLKGFCDFVLYGMTASNLEGPDDPRIALLEQLKASKRCPDSASCPTASTKRRIPSAWRFPSAEPEPSFTSGRPRCITFAAGTALFLLLRPYASARARGDAGSVPYWPRLYDTAMSSKASASSYRRERMSLSRATSSPRARSTSSLALARASSSSGKGSGSSSVSANAVSSSRSSTEKGTLRRLRMRSWPRSWRWPAARAERFARIEPAQAAPRLKKGLLRSVLRFFRIREVARAEGVYARQVARDQFAESLLVPFLRCPRKLAILGSAHG